MVTSYTHFVLIFMSAATLTACGTRTADKTPPETHTEVTGNEITTHTIETISQGVLYCNEGVIVPTGGIVITNEDEWQDFQNLLTAANTTSEVVGAAPVDFDREMIIGYFDELRGSLNTAVNIESVTEKLSGLIVNYSVAVNNVDPAAEVINQPYMLIRMKKRNKTVTFASTF